MKNTLQVLKFLSYIFLAATMLSCSAEKGQEGAIEEVAEQAANPTVAAYLVLKDALVETDAARAAKAAVNLAEASEGELKDKATQIANSTDVETQRATFEEVSKLIYAQMKAENSSGQTLYKQYCPMAFNDKGAFWLSSEKEIMNPYFGDKMLHCGKVEETLTAN